MLKRLSLILLAAGMVSFLGAGYVLADVVYGHVVNASRDPLSGVDIHIDMTVGTDTAALGDVVSDENGDYALTDTFITNGGTLDLTFVKSKYVSGALSELVSDDYTAKCSEVMLLRGTGTEHSLEINVTNGSSTAVPGAKVKLARAGIMPVIEYTKNDGSCVFDRLREKIYTYTVTASGYKRLRGTKDISVNSNPVNAVLVAQ